jgi:hypothetical protein
MSTSGQGGWSDAPGSSVPSGGNSHDWYGRAPTGYMAPPWGYNYGSNPPGLLSEEPVNPNPTWYDTTGGGTNGLYPQTQATPATSSLTTPKVATPSAAAQPYTFAGVSIAPVQNSLAFATPEVKSAASPSANPGPDSLAGSNTDLGATTRRSVGFGSTGQTNPYFFRAYGQATASPQYNYF